MKRAATSWSIEQNCYGSCTHPGPAPALGSEEKERPASPGVADLSIVEHVNSVWIPEPNGVVDLGGVLPRDQKGVILDLHRKKFWPLLKKYRLEWTLSK